jgi:hypothetical protein
VQVNGHLIHDFFYLLGSALTLNREVFVAVRDDPRALVVSFLIAFVAGCSYTIGRSVVLFANRVPRNRFIRTVILAAIVYVVRAVIWCISAWLIARVLFGRVPFNIALLAVLLGQAPQVFSFLVMVPYVGSSLRRLLDAYAFVVVLAATRTMLDASITRTLLCVTAGWFVQSVIADLLERPLAGVHPWMWRASAGQTTPSTEEAVRQQVLTGRV